jgi:hypothetical protein
MSCAPVSAPLVHSREISAVGARVNTCDHVCEEPRECRLVPPPVWQPVTIGRVIGQSHILALHHVKLAFPVTVLFCKVQAGW